MFSEGIKRSVAWNGLRRIPTSFLFIREIRGHISVIIENQLNTTCLLFFPCSITYWPNKSKIKATQNQKLRSWYALPKVCALKMNSRSLKATYGQVCFNKNEFLIPGHTHDTNLAANATKVLTCVWPFCGHFAL